MFGNIKLIVRMHGSKDLINRAVYVMILLTVILLKQKLSQVVSTQGCDAQDLNSNTVLSFDYVATVLWKNPIPELF